MGTQYIPQMPDLLEGRQPGTSEADLGITSDIFDREWNEFLARRMELYQNMTGRLGLAQGIAAATGLTPEEALPAAHIEMDSVWTDKAKERFAAMGQNDLNDLIGQARAHGIDSPERLPADVLFQMIEERRAAVKGRDISGGQPTTMGEMVKQAVGRGFISGVTGGVPSTALSEQVDAFALGTLGGMVDVIQRIPFIGDALAKRRAVQSADQTINMALEGLRADLPEERLKAFNAAAGTGAFVGYTYLGSIAYRGAAAVIPAAAIVNGKRIDTLGRAALRGALTAWALEGGGDDPIMPSEETWRAIVGGDWKRGLEILETRSGKIAAGGAFGAFFDYALPNLVRRVQASFRSRMATENVSRPAVGQRRQQLDSGIAEADYTIVEQGGLPGPQRALSPGQQAIEPGPDIFVTPRPQGPTGMSPITTPAPGSMRQLPPAAGPMGLVQQLDQVGVQMGPAGWDIMYHGATDPLTAMRSGFHLGTSQAALQRVSDVTQDAMSRNWSIGLGQIYPIAIDPQARMMGSRMAPAIGDINPDVGIFDSPEDEAIFLQAEREGYQGIYYRNSQEDPGSVSLYLFDPSVAQVLQPTVAPVPPVEQAPLLLGTSLHNENAALRAQLSQMTEQRNLAQRMAEMDPLTNLGNRRAMERAMPAVAADPNMAVISWDADQFKPINDIFGHEAGDRALVAFANHLNQVADFHQVPVRNFRPGGDEFVTIVPRDLAESFLMVVEEHSAQRFQGDAGEVTTRLTGAIGTDYAEADANLISRKGGRRTAVQGLSAEEAVTEARTLTRQNQMLESPLMNEVMEQPVFDGETLAQALVMSNPSGVNVLRDVGDAGVIIRRLAEADQSLPLTGVLQHPSGLESLDIRHEGSGYRLRRTNLEQTPFREATREDQILTQLFDVDTTFEPDATSAIHAARRMGYVVPTRRVMPQFMRVVEPRNTGPIQLGPNRRNQDLLISAGRPITNTMVSEYEATGAFTGATVLTDDGLIGTVEMVFLDDDPSIVLALPGQAQRLDYYPGSYTLVPEDINLPQDFDLFYEDFRDYVITEFDSSAFIGEEGAVDFLSESALGQMPRMLDDFMDRLEIEDILTRSALRAGVNHNINRDLQALAAPEDQAILNRAMELLDGTAARNAPARRRRRGESLETKRAGTGASYQVPRPSLPTVQTLAEMKGFDYIPTAPPPLRFGAEIDIIASREDPNYPGSYGSQADVYVQLTDTRTNEYAGELAATLQADGTLYVDGTAAHEAGGPNALGPRMVRDVGRQLVQAIRAQGLTVNQIGGYRVSGARRHQGSYGGTADTEMMISADQIMRGVRAGGTLKHKFTDLEVPVDSDAAALEFLREFQGDLPDIAPITGYPIDALPIGPGMDNPGHSLPPVWDEGFEQYMDTYMDMTDGLESYLDDVLSTDLTGQTLPPGLAPDQWTGGNLPPGGGGPPPTRYTGAPLSSGGRPGGGFPSTDVRSETLGQQFRTVARNNPAAVGDLLRQQESAWLRLLEPMRHRFLSLEQQLTNLGVDKGQIWRQYAEMTTAVDKSHNEANPWHREWSDVTSAFRRKYRRDGTVVRIEEIPNWNDKLRAMQEAGYTPAEMEAQRAIRPFFDRMHGEAGLTHYIFDYIPHLRQRQGMNGIENPFDGTQAGLPRELQFFAEHVRAGNVDMRQLDIGTLGALWIRGWQFKKHVGPIWDEMYQAWNSAGVPERLKNLVMDWMHVVRVGHDPKEEIAVAGARQVLNNLGVPVTSGEIAGLWNGLLTNTYRSMLGGRPDVIFRDAIQPMLTWARVGGNVEDMAGVYTDFIRSPKARGEMIERAERMGTVVRGMTQTAYAEAFTQRVQTTEGYPVFSEAMQQRREAAATVGDFLHDLVPRRFRGGIQGTYADPLLMYTKLGEFNRIVSGEYGYRTARKALDQYFGGKMDYTTLVAQSRARVYPQPIQRRFQELVQSGDKEGAAALLANEAANLQFRYGSREGPIGTRNVPGRLSMMFGTFSQQFLAYTKEGLSNGTMGDRAGFGARYAAILAAIGGAGAYTGWKFSKWMWHNSLAFAGGPLVEFAATAAHAAGGFAAKAQGQDPRPHQVRAMQEMVPENVAGGFLESVFPYSGAVRTMQNFGNTIGPGSAHQGERTMELLLTGNRQWENIYNRDYRSDIQPYAPDFSQPSYWQPNQGTGGFPQPGQQQRPVPQGLPIPQVAPAPGIQPVNPGDTLSSGAVDVMREALRTTPPADWESRMRGAKYNEAIIQQVIRVGAGAVQ